MSSTQVRVLHRSMALSNSLILGPRNISLTGLSQPPCMRMPPEILSKIFLIHLSDLRDKHLENLLDPWRDSPSPRYYKWILVTHVCRYWRHVAHHYAKLWTFVALQPSTVPGVLHPEVLQRAGALPLSIVYHQVRSRTREGKGWRTPAVAHLGHLLPTIQNLYLVLDDTDCTAGELCNALRRPAEHLETLHIAFGSERPHQLVAQNREIPPVLFSCNVPMLHTLTISNGDFAWNNSLFRPTLRHLEILHRKRLEPAAAGMRMFIDMLATLPLLETLIIDSVPECSAVDTIANLPALRLLEVRGSVRKTALLLSHVRFPVSTTISIGIPCGTCELTAAELESLAHALHPILQEEPLHTVYYAVFAQSNDVPSADTCRAWAGEPTDVDQSQLPSAAVAQRLILTGDGSRALSPVLRSLDLSHVRSVQVLGSGASVGPLPSWLEGVSDTALVEASTLVRLEEDSPVGEVTEEAQAVTQHPRRPAGDVDNAAHAPISGREALHPTLLEGALLAPEGLSMGPKPPAFPFEDVGYRGGNPAGAGWMGGARWVRDDGHQNYRVRGGPACAACALTAEAYQYKLPPMLG
ncbi:hypothetical protein LXA43DRAFT_1096772 [Ganoderma leucocontextum]|nr:hypothetical protein LXA43DRAFT_1096772 [Ganoderma leucocontextum]